MKTFDPTTFKVPHLTPRDMMLDISKLHPESPLMQWQVRNSPPRPDEVVCAHIAGRGPDVPGCVYFWITEGIVRGNVYYEVTPKQLTEMRKIGEFPEGAEPDMVFDAEFTKGWGREILNRTFPAHRLEYLHKILDEATSLAAAADFAVATRKLQELQHYTGSEIKEFATRAAG